MLIEPKQLGASSLSREAMLEDRKKCRRIGPCGLGEKALYLNSFYLQRRYYLPLSSIQRVYKRIAMTKGGFTGKGAFASIPYLVVEYDGSREKQCNFKHEEQVDILLSEIKKSCPGIKTLSKTAEAAKARKEAELLEKRKKEEALSPELAERLRYLDKAAAYLEREPDKYIELAAASKAKRVYYMSNPAYKWVALFIVLMGTVSLIYGAYSLITGSGDFGLYFLLFGLAGVFLFSGAHVLPTARNNRSYIEKRFIRAADAMKAYTSSFSYGKEGFPVPPQYAHPIVLRWMRDIIVDGLAADTEGAYEELKKKLKSLNSDVTVEQDVYEETVTIKPMFLVNDYQ